MKLNKYKWSIAYLFEDTHITLFLAKYCNHLLNLLKEHLVCLQEAVFILVKLFNVLFH